MELQCPHCQNQLIIEEQYAGQPMKCPMCQGTFHAPALPEYSASASSLPDPSAPPATPAPSTESPAPPAAPPGEGQQSVASEAPPASQQPFSQAQATWGAATQPFERPARPTEHQHRISMWLDPYVVQWISVGAIVLVFVLTFFTWVWFGYGSEGVFSQNAWHVAFSGASLDDDHTVTKDLEIDRRNIGANVLSIFYLLLLILTVLFVITIAVLGELRLSLTPALLTIMNLRWTIAAALLLLTFFLLALQMISGFSAESYVYGQVNEIALEMPDEMYLAGLQRGRALSLAFWMHFLSLAAAGYVCWMEMRKTAPVPRIDVVW